MKSAQKSSYRWIVFTTVAFAYLCIVIQRTAPGLITDQLMEEFRISAATFGLLTGLQFLAYAGLQVPFGILADRFGPAWFLIIGTLLDGIGTIVYSTASQDVALMLARLLVGSGDAMIWINVVLLLSQWFHRREFAALLGWAGMSGSIGSMIATVPFAAWIAAAGWRIPFFVSGGLLCILSFLLYMVLVRKVKNLPLAQDSKPRPMQESTVVILRRTFRGRQAWASFFCHFGLVGTYIGFIGSWAVPYGMTMYDLTRAQASQLVMLGLVGALLGAPFVGWISTRFQMRKLPYIIVHAIAVGSWLTFVCMNGKPPLVLVMLLYVLIGFTNGGSVLTFAVVRHSFLQTEVGVVSGFANMGGFLSAVFLPILFGTILDMFSTHVGYQYGFFIPVLFSFLGLLGGFAIIEERHKTTTKLQTSS